MLLSSCITISIVGVKEVKKTAEKTIRTPGGDIKLKTLLSLGLSTWSDMALQPAETL